MLKLAIQFIVCTLELEGIWFFCHFKVACTLLLRCLIRWIEVYSVVVFLKCHVYFCVYYDGLFFASAYYQTITSTERRTMVFIILVRLTRRTEQMRLFDLQKQKANDALNFFPSISVFVFTCLAIASNDEACSMLHFATYIFNIPFTCQWINTVFQCML